VCVGVVSFVVPSAKDSHRVLDLVSQREELVCRELLQNDHVGEIWFPRGK
jgi:hypothetical protein